jgi:hypothetical protein
MLYYVFDKREDRVKHYGLEHVKMNESSKNNIRTVNWPTGDDFFKSIKASAEEAKKAGESYIELIPKKLVRMLVYIPEEIRGDKEAIDNHTSNIH